MADNERSESHEHTYVTKRALEFAAVELGCTPDELATRSVDGGYSRNRRSIVTQGDRSLFVKEVDVSLLKDDGAEELGWLKKDHEMVQHFAARKQTFVAEWSKLSADGTVLLLPAYLPEDGWLWSVPESSAEQAAYVAAVVNATKQLESAQFSQGEIRSLRLEPFFRDELALDDGFALLENEAIRQQVLTKFASVKDAVPEHIAVAIDELSEVLQDEKAWQSLSQKARALALQPNDHFGHCDVRSDNLAYNQITGEVKLVDWNWASFAPSKFGATEFLVDMARRGIDVSPWNTDINPELLAASVGFWARRCIKDPLRPGSDLREMQAESAAMAYKMYQSITEPKGSMDQMEDTTI